MNRSHKPVFIVYGPNYDLKNGGSLVFHYLCHYLNLNGYPAYFWPYGKVLFKGNNTREWISSLKRNFKRVLKRTTRVSSELKTPIANARHLKNAIVVYPGKTSGNPLNASNVVRYNLHVPGFHTGIVDYGPGELYFYYRDKFSVEKLGLEPSYPLYIPIILDEVFKQKNFGKRNGSCYILRKGKNRTITHDLSGGVIIDDLNPEQIADVFNKVEFCISYDMDTFFSHYAAICGCKSIVVPEAGVSKEEWCPDIGLRYGIAYGESDLKWASETLPLLKEYLASEKNENLKKVGFFATTCEAFFNERLPGHHKE